MEEFRPKPHHALEAYLYCRSCRDDQLHRLVYAGRLLYSSHCFDCGHEVYHGQHDLAATYMRDLEHRLLTKPRRLVRRARQNPINFARTLPGALSRQPRKLAREVLVVFNDASRRLSR